MPRNKGRMAYLRYRACSSGIQNFDKKHYGDVAGNRLNRGFQQNTGWNSYYVNKYIKE